VPYGNSTSLPFSKQFFVGGASSLRGFQSRSVGPGTYKNTEDNDDSFFDQSGDILVEFNFENRTNLGQYIQGAAFIDVGNVWLKNASETRPGGVFKWNSFMTQMAVDAGVGIRLNFDFVVLRLDWAIPLRIPYLPDGDQWVADKISISKRYRKDNLIWNLAIGYPF
jgi:outer membrane protein assembly factor BamA